MRGSDTSTSRVHATGSEGSADGGGWPGQSHSCASVRRCAEGSCSASGGVTCSCWRVSFKSGRRSCADASRRRNREPLGGSSSSGAELRSCSRGTGGPPRTPATPISSSATRKRAGRWIRAGSPGAGVRAAQGGTLPGRDHREVHPCRPGPLPWSSPTRRGQDLWRSRAD